MECYTSRDLIFSYPPQEKKVFDKLTFSVERGQFVPFAAPLGGHTPEYFTRK